MDHWKRFASFFFLYRADTNPDGVPPQPTQTKEQIAAAKKKEKAANKTGGCVVM